MLAQLATSCPCSVVQEPAHQRQLHSLLWNHAVSLMGAGQFEAALRFFAASLSLEQGQQERLQGLHAQALCCASMGAHDRCAWHATSCGWRLASIVTWDPRLPWTVM